VVPDTGGVSTSTSLKYRSCRCAARQLQLWYRRTPLELAHLAPDDLVALRELPETLIRRTYTPARVDQERELDARFSLSISEWR